jgi:hypothetical protein
MDPTDDTVTVARNPNVFSPPVEWARQRWKFRSLTSEEGAQSPRLLTYASVVVLGWLHYDPEPRDSQVRVAFSTPGGII